MSETIKIKDYLVSVSKVTRFITVDGKRFQLRSLFFPQRFAEGQHAFTRYEDLVESATAEHETAEVFDIERMQHKLQQYSGKQKMPGSIVTENKQTARRFESEKQISYINSALNLALYKTERQENTNLLFEENTRGACDKLLFHNPLESRVIVLANAGFGKTTLIRRIALAICGKFLEKTNADNTFLSSVGEDVQTPIMPCIIPLRDYRDNLMDVENLIIDSVSIVMNKQYDKSEIKSWINSNSDTFVLLIDGLDELPSELIIPFLSGLDTYLAVHKKTRVIMTSRVSGIDREEVKDYLQTLKFRGRTILPLNNNEVKQFCEQWISETGSSLDLLNSLKRIQTETYLGYLREFTRKPLELIILLQYLPRQSYSTFNRWDLFYNILWAEITNHVEFDLRQRVYDDECKFLSFIAYQMQIRSKLSITYNELSELVPAITKLSFYTNLFEVSPEETDLNVDHIWNHLRLVAQDIGTVEIIENTHTVTIPLRPYQEYLTAYASCNLCLIENELQPDPSKILFPHLNDANWLGVISFAIAGMESGNYGEFDSFLSSLYTSIDSIIMLCDLLEMDFSNSRDVAKSLCKAKLHSISMSDDERLLVQKCMKSKSSVSFRYALSALFKEAYESNTLYFWEAASYAYLIDAIGKKKDPILQAISMYGSAKKHEKIISLGMLILTARASLGEIELETDLSSSLFLPIPISLVKSLYDDAISNKSFLFVNVLTELYISQLPGVEKIATFLDAQLLTIACNYLYANSDRIKKALINGSINSDYLKHIRSVLTSIGLFPYQLKKNLGPKERNVWINALVSAFYECAIDDISIDQVGAAICNYFIYGSYEEFISAWVEDICKGRPSSEVNKNHLSKRECKHFKIVRDTISNDETRYFANILTKLNDPRFMVESTPANLFASGNDSAALELALKMFGEENKENNNNNNNLAFLVRYLKYDPSSLLHISRYELIETLLLEGVRQHEAYSSMNYVLSLIEQNRIDEARVILKQIDPKRLADIANDFWYPIMWKKRKEVEGAFVCVISQNTGENSFTEYDEMQKFIKELSPAMVSMLS